MSASGGNPFNNLARIVQPTGEETPEKTLIRQEFLMLARVLEGHAPECAERTLSLRKLQESLFWAIETFPKG